MVKKNSKKDTDKKANVKKSPKEKSNKIKSALKKISKTKDKKKSTKDLKLKKKNDLVKKNKEKKITKNLKKNIIKNSKEVNKTKIKKIKEVIKVKKSSNKDVEKKIKSKTSIKKTADFENEQNNDNKKSEKIIKKKNENNGQGRFPFRAGEFAVYPSHGVGKIIDIENTLIMGQDYSCYLMYFEKEKLSIKIPVTSAEKNNLRRVASKSQIEEVLNILRSGIKKLKGMWSRRAQEYETKINSGDIILLAEVLRDLTRDIDDSERSYSERIIYETAIFRLASEYAIVYNVDIEIAKEKIINIAKDKINSEIKNSKDDFDDFEIEERKGKKHDIDEDGDEDDEDDEEEEEEDDDFNYNFDEIDDEDDDDTPKKKRK